MKTSPCFLTAIVMAACVSTFVLMNVPASYGKEALPATKSAKRKELSKVELNRFEDSIKEYEKKDKIKQVPVGGTEFVGSSSITMWESIPQDFKGLNAFGRGFGGSTIPEVTHFADRIILKYKPSRIVFYAGTNDIAEGHSAKQVHDDFISFVKKIHSTLPQTDIYFISMSMAPSRVQWEREFKEGNQLIKKETEKNKKLHYIDIAPQMQDSSGKPLDMLFGPDRLHMVRDGYEIWIREIKKAIPVKS